MTASQFEQAQIITAEINRCDRICKEANAGMRNASMTISEIDLSEQEAQGILEFIMDHFEKRRAALKEKFAAIGCASPAPQPVSDITRFERHAKLVEEIQAARAAMAPDQIEEPQWPRIRHLPESEQGPFRNALIRHGYACPKIPGVMNIDQDAYYPCDYQRWKAGLPVVD